MQWITTPPFGSGPVVDVLAHQRAVAAIINTKRGLPEYFRKTIRQRLDSPERAGSYYPGIRDEETLIDILLALPWQPTTEFDQVLIPGTIAFTARFPGIAGVVDLMFLEDNQVVTLDDRKGTGNLSATVALPLESDAAEVMFSTLILGHEDGTDGEVVFTVHPGAPVKASQLKVGTWGLRHGDTITVIEALRLGLCTAKVVG